VKGFIDISEKISSIIIIIIIIDIYCQIPFFPGDSLEPAVIPIVQASISHCSTFRLTLHFKCSKFSCLL